MLATQHMACQLSMCFASLYLPYPRPCDKRPVQIGLWHVLEPTLPISVSALLASALVVVPVSPASGLLASRHLPFWVSCGVHVTRHKLHKTQLCDCSPGCNCHMPKSRASRWSTPRTGRPQRSFRTCKLDNTKAPCCAASAYSDYDRQRAHWEKLRCGRSTHPDRQSRHRR